MSIRGAWAASLTPVTSALEPDYQDLARWATSLIERGLDGAVIFGTTGEATSFSLEQRRRGLEAVRAELDAARTIVGVGTTSLADTAGLIRHASSIGVAGALVLPPFYYQADEPGLLEYFQQLALLAGDDNVPLLLYHIPQVSGVAIFPSVAAQLYSDQPDVFVGVKDSSGDRDSLLAFIEAMPGGSVMAGNETLLPLCLESGGAGTISGPANLFAGLVARLAGDPRDGSALDSMVTIRAHLAAYQAVPALKALAARWTDFESMGRSMPPLTSLADSESDDLVGALAASGFHGLV